MCQYAWQGDKLAEISAEGDKRILLTRDHGLLKRKQVIHGYFVRNDQPALQIREVLAKFHLQQSIHVFSRCTQCNGLIKPVTKEQVIERLPAGVAKVFDEFVQCDTCQRVYWKGSHYDHMQKIIDDILND